MPLSPFHVSIYYIYEVSDDELTKFVELLGDFLVGVLPGPKIVVKRPINGYRLNAILTDSDAYVTNLREGPEVRDISGIYEPRDGDLIIFPSHDLLYIQDGYPIYIRRAYRLVAMQPIFTVDGYIRLKSLGLDPAEVASRISKMLEQL